MTVEVSEVDQIKRCCPAEDEHGEQVVDGCASPTSWLKTFKNTSACAEGVLCVNRGTEVLQSSCFLFIEVLGPPQVASPRDEVSGAGWHSCSAQPSANWRILR